MRSICPAISSSLGPKILPSFRGFYDGTDSAVYNKRVRCIAYINLFIILNTTYFGRAWPSSGVYIYDMYIDILRCISEYVIRINAFWSYS
jgi:hypothetical protein